MFLSNHIITDMYTLCMIEIMISWREMILNHVITTLSYTVCSLYINTIPEKSRNQLICSFVFLINIFQSDQDNHLKDSDEITKLHGTYNEGLFKTENYCLYLAKGFVSEISQGELASYFFVHCQKLVFINCCHVYGSRISFSYLRNLPNSAPQWEHLCTQSLALGTQKGMAKHPSHILQRIYKNVIKNSKKKLNDKILIFSI